MKKILLTLLVFLFLISSCSKSNVTIDNNAVLSYIDDNYNDKTGYVDVTDFYYEHYFKEVDEIASVKILVNTESTNFDEIGIFEFKNDRSAKKYISVIKNYINGSVDNFKNGIIYDINEYPKFENASVVRNSNIVVYMILDKERSKEIINLLKK